MQIDFLLTNQESLKESEWWTDVAGFPRYEVSTEGRFRRKFTGRILGGTVSNNGYVHIGLVKDGVQITKLAHRLIALSFLKQPSEAHRDVNHKNKVRSDNRVSNLEWSTRSWNSKHSKIRQEDGMIVPPTVRPPATAQGPLDPTNNNLREGLKHYALDRPPVACKTTL